MNIKIIEENKLIELEKRVNSFIKNKKVKDVKIIPVNHQSEYTGNGERWAGHSSYWTSYVARIIY